MMIRFINRITGAEMMVASDRVEEYKAAGHKLAADLGTKPIKKALVQPEQIEKPAEDPAEVPAPAASKRVGRKKK